VRLDVLYCRGKDIKRIHIGYPVVDIVHRGIENILGNGLLAIMHQAIDELAGKHGVIARIWFELFSAGSYPSHRCSFACLLGLGLFHSVTTARLASTIDSERIKGSTDHLVTYTGQIPDATASNEHDRVFLQVVSFTRDVNSCFFPVGESYSSNLAQGRVRFLGCHGPHLQADTLFLRAAIQHRCLGLLSLLQASLANQLVNCWH